MNDNSIRERIFSTLRMNLNSSDIQKQKETQLIQEYSVMKTFQTSGVYILPTRGNIRSWNGVIFIRSGPFMDSILKFRIEIPLDYPSSPPSVFFLNDTFHPLIDRSSGKLNILPRFPEWNPSSDYLFLLVAYVREVFYNKDLWTEQHVYNRDALDAFQNDLDLFKSQIKQCTVASYQNIYESTTDFPMQFSQFNANHRRALDLVRIKDISETDEELYESFMARFKKEFK